MGWAPLKRQKDCPLLDKNEAVEWVYFVHSYSAIPEESTNLAATTDFGKEKVTAIVLIYIIEGPNMSIR